MTPEPSSPRTRATELLRAAEEELALEALHAASSSPAIARWLCLVPTWTPRLAERCGLPGWSDRSDPMQLAAWRDEGMVESTLTALAIDEAGQYVPTQRLFWMPRDARAAWLSLILEEDGRDNVAALMRDVARRVLEQPRDHHLPAATLRWATLVAASAPPALSLGSTFDTALDSALSAGRPDEAWLWIEALQRVADVLPGETTTLHQRAVRRLALFDRERNDRAFLRDYLPRATQFADWHELLTGPDALWGLHYLGGGGVGKTMLMRALTSGTKEHRPPGFDAPPAVSARIDFDHIDPAYPARKPGLLFAQLAEELRLKDGSGHAAAHFARVFQAIAFLHETEIAQDAQETAIGELVEVFAWACEALSAGSGCRVVLLLDTCEELARLGPHGRLPDSVQRTFALLERLHARLPSLRVVLCGRRPLAGRYADSAIVSPDLPERPWLRLHRMFPFSEQEARAYLSRAGVPDVLVPPVLARSTAAASSASLGLPAQREAPRYSPFSLSMYATWVTRAPGAVSAETILHDPVDHFVRIRILDRIHNPDVRRLLPHVALLGRFDEATLRACGEMRAEAGDAVCREIASQEWIARLAGGYYAVEGELRARLLRYFRQEAPQELHAARRRLLAHAATTLARTPDGERFDDSLAQAFVQLQAHDRAGVLGAWRLLDDRIVNTGDVDWGERVLGRLLAADPADDVAFDRGALGAFMTTYAECLLRRTGGTAGTDAWGQAWDFAQALDPGDVRDAVLVRAASGALAQSLTVPGAGAEFDTWAVRLSNLLAERRGAVTQPALVAPVIAALLSCADGIERRGELDAAPPALERIAGIVADVRRAPERALALTCVARFAARRQDADVARLRFAAALETVAGEHGQSVVPCLHWPATLDASSWVALEAIRGLVGLEPKEDTLARLDRLPPVSQPAVAIRLASLRLTLLGAIGVPALGDSAPAVRSVSAAGHEHAGPVNAAQLAVLPAAVVHARDLVECGRPSEGVQHLREFASVAASRRSTALVRAVEGVYVDAITRMRLGEFGFLARHLAGGAGILPLAERERMRAFLPDISVASVSEEPRTRADRHAIWRARRAFDDKTRVALARWGHRFLTAPVAAEGLGEFARASVALDLVECSELGAKVEPASHDLAPESPEHWWNRHPALPEQALRLWIRSAALGVSPGGPTTGLVRCVGVRRAAAIALDEGELLALRLPTPAMRLLALALTWYEDAHDSVGVWLVTTLLTLTRVRAGVTRDAVDLGALHAAHDLLQAHQAASGLGDAVLPWPALEGARIPLSAPPAVAEWIPWLHRIVALQQWKIGGVRPEVLFGDPSALPVELRDWPSGGDAGLTRITQTGAVAPPMPPRSTTPVVADADASEPPPADRAAGLPAASTSLPVIVDTPPPRPPARRWVGAAFGVAVVLVAAGATAAGAPLWVAALLSMGLLGAIAWAWKTRAAAPAPVETWTVQVTAARSSPGSTRLGALDVAVSLADGSGAPVTQFPLRVRRTDAYAGLDALRQPPAGTALSSPLPSSPPLERAWLDVALATAWPCWEALVWSGIVEHDRLRPAVVRRVRAVRAPAATAWSPGRAWVVATVAPSPADQRQALYAWEPAARGGHVQLQAIAAEQVRQGSSHPEIALVHVVARTVDTPNGLFFEMDRGERSDVQGTLESLSGNRGTLLDASLLVHAFPGVAAVLIQSPRRPALDVSPATRETCAQLRIIGAALAEHGVPLVVVLPPLDGELGAELVRLFGRRLAAARTGRLIDPHEFTTRARQVVFTLAQRLLPRDSASELALQVTVYVARTP